VRTGTLACIAGRALPLGVAYNETRKGIVNYLHRPRISGDMARSKTSTFTLTERISSATATGGVYTGTLDIGGLVDVADRQGLAIESVDFVTQVYDVTNNLYSSDFQLHLAGDCVWDMQLSDLNPGGAILPADDNNLIASGSLFFDDGNNVASLGPDLYPDNFGKLDEARIVINDQMYFVVDASSAPAAGQQFTTTVRIRCRAVTLGMKDWMALAITSVSND